MPRDQLTVLTKHSPSEDLLRFFSKTRSVSHGCDEPEKRKMYEFVLHQPAADEKNTHVDVSFPEGHGIISEGWSEEELDKQFDDPDWRLPGTIALLQNCEGNYAMTLALAMEIYLSVHNVEKIKADFSEDTKICQP